MENQEIILRGVRLLPGFLNLESQYLMLDELRAVARDAPFLRPITRQGPMSVQMTSAGRLGWVADKRGYHYEPLHPTTHKAWPAIPESILKVWRQVSGVDVDPTSCLINLYRADSKMGMHQDRDEGDFSYPVVSISLGDEALFRVGSVERGGKTASTWLRSGDVAIIGGDARLVYHGIDRIRGGSSSLIKGGGRINITLRVVVPQ